MQLVGLHHICEISEVILLSAASGSMNLGGSIIMVLSIILALAS